MHAWSRRRWKGLSKYIKILFLFIKLLHLKSYPPGYVHASLPSIYTAADTTISAVSRLCSLVLWVKWLQQVDGIWRKHGLHGGTPLCKLSPDRLGYCKNSLPPRKKRLHCCSSKSSILLYTIRSSFFLSFSNFCTSSLTQLFHINEEGRLGFNFDHRLGFWEYITIVLYHSLFAQILLFPPLVLGLYNKILS